MASEPTCAGSGTGRDGGRTLRVKGPTSRRSPVRLFPDYASVHSFRVLCTSVVNPGTRRTVTLPGEVPSLRSCGLRQVGWTRSPVVRTNRRERGPRPSRRALRLLNVFGCGDPSRVACAAQSTGSGAVPILQWFPERGRVPAVRKSSSSRARAPMALAFAPGVPFGQGAGRDRPGLRSIRCLFSRVKPSAARSAAPGEWATAFERKNPPGLAPGGLVETVSGR